MILDHAKIWFLLALCLYARSWNTRCSLYYFGPWRLSGFIHLTFGISDVRKPTNCIFLKSGLCLITQLHSLLLPCFSQPIDRISLSDLDNCILNWTFVTTSQVCKNTRYRTKFKLDFLPIFFLRYISCGWYLHCICSIRSPIRPPIGKRTRQNGTPLFDARKKVERMLTKCKSFIRLLPL